MMHNILLDVQVRSGEDPEKAKTGLTEYLKEVTLPEMSGYLPKDLMRQRGEHRVTTTLN